MSNQQVFAALEVVRTECKDEYARAYAAAAIQYSLHDDALRTQVLYVLSNAGGWRGQTARETKATLRNFLN